MIRKTMVLGTLLAGLTAAPAMAQQNYIGNVVGGGVARMVGGGAEAQVVYDQVTQAQAPRLAKANGRQDGGWTVQYLEPVPAPTGQGMIAHLVGGGQDAQVVFEVPAGAPQTHLATAPVGAPRS